MHRDGADEQFQLPSWRTHSCPPTLAGWETRVPNNCVDQKNFDPLFFVLTGHMEETIYEDRRRVPLRLHHLRRGSRSRQGRAMPLYGLPDLIGVCLSHECPLGKG